MKVLLDVGAHTGQTLAAAQRWDFERIVCFEPAAVNLEALRKLADERTVIQPFGLLDKDVQTILYNGGSKGASVLERPGRPTAATECRFVRASTWLVDNLPPDDKVWMKLNIEGAELDVIEDLLDTGTLAYVDYLLVMWDSRKIPSIAARGVEVRKRLEAVVRAPHLISSDQFPNAATCEARIDAWLSATGGVKRL